jgi:hypothetical protein
MAVAMLSVAVKLVTVRIVADQHKVGSVSEGAKAPPVAQPTS